MAFSSRDAAIYVNPSEVADWVKDNIIPGYLVTVVSAILVYDASKQSSPTHLPLADVTPDSMYVRAGGERQPPN